ncbi:hypothetical protein SteCoe_16335 [Stentor coeruleus]|uniref:EF-hand domain-containing protein n=1 Tax=Stentor coeruleus TaxID=5963 RepID=A0A1R2C1K3_9CILI|nr:hypothetical protein SteCoe_16335 [Stentor coeruleus]
MLGKIILLLICFSIVQAENEIKLHYFKSLDRNHDSKLTHRQFVDGLNRALSISGIERDRIINNNFAWEFLGEKDSNGSVDLALIEQWISSGEILRAFEEWKSIHDEGEEHSSPSHIHKMKSLKFGGGRGGKTKIGKKNEL